MRIRSNETVTKKNRKMISQYILVAKSQNFPVVTPCPSRGVLQQDSSAAPP